MGFVAPGPGPGPGAVGQRKRDRGAVRLGDDDRPGRAGAVHDRSDEHLLELALGQAEDSEQERLRELRVARDAGRDLAVGDLGASGAGERLHAGADRGRELLGRRAGTSDHVGRVVPLASATDRPNLVVADVEDNREVRVGVEFREVRGVQACVAGSGRCGLVRAGVDVRGVARS